MDGGSGWDRTNDRSIKSRELLPLSYGPRPDLDLRHES